MVGVGGDRAAKRLIPPRPAAPNFALRGTVQTGASMTPRILVFQHGDYCPPGTLGDHLAADGLEPLIISLDQGEAIPDLERFDILMVMGGAMDVWEEEAHPWLVSEKAAIHRWVYGLDKPYLGVCLGHQLLADSLGGKVRRAAKPEIALLDIELSDAGRRHGLFSGFGATKRVVQWHGAEVAAPPPESVVLASTADCPVTAFGVGSAAFGIQYHVEATDQSISEWADLESNSKLLDRLHGPGAAASLRAKVTSAMPVLRANSRRFYENFMAIARRRLAGES